jgi:hypothetical protein
MTYSSKIDLKRNESSQKPEEIGFKKGNHGHIQIFNHRRPPDK